MTPSEIMDNYYSWREFFKKCGGNNMNNEERLKILNGDWVPDSDTLTTIDEIKNCINDKYGLARAIDKLVSECTLRKGSLVDCRLLIISIFEESKLIYFFDLRTYRLEVMYYDKFIEFITEESINVHNFIDIRERLFDNPEYNNNIKQMESEFKSMFDDRMKAVIENVCQEAAKNFTDNFIDEMMMIKEQEDY